MLRARDRWTEGHLVRRRTARRDVRVAIVGAGLGGIAAAVKLTRAGFDDVTVFEKAGGPGGVWWQNTYPGCEVDVASLAYSFSFLPYDWSRTHARQPELLAYAREVIAHFGLERHFRYRTEVRSAHWDETAAGYLVRTRDGSAELFDVVVSCVGMLSHPRLPDWPGMDRFTGPMFHTSRYEHQHDLRGRRVAVVGTGSTACQLVPAIADQVGHLDLYQREPGFVLPKRVRELSAADRERYRRAPWLRRLDRLRLFRTAHRDARAIRADSSRQRELRDFALRYITGTVRDPRVREAVTPGYAFGCKRPVLAGDFYPALNRPNVDLVPHAVTSVQADGLVDDTGTFRPADVIILATGFQATRYLATLEVRGRGGRDLQEHWAGEPSAFLGVTVPGFPNFFILYGPNTNGGWSVTVQLERQADLVVRAVRRLARGRARSVDTRPEVAARYDRWLQAQIATRLSALLTGCGNYYHSATGRNVTQWPRSHTTYLALTRLLPRWGLVFRDEPAAAPAPVEPLDASPVAPLDDPLDEPPVAGEPDRRTA
jgi:cation diffusion facilitator CzcD-associated flavoprotein CzcO